MAALDTLANVKARLGITTDADDTFLQGQIDYLSSIIEAYCGRIFTLDDYIQTFYREDYEKASQREELFHYPVNAITEVKIDDEVQDLDDYRLNKPTGIVTSLTNSFPQGQVLVVKFNAGYQNVPLPVLGVLDDLVSQRYNKKLQGIDLNFGTDVQRISIAGAVSIDFDYSLDNNNRKSAYGSVIGNNANVLDHWRSNRAVLNVGKLIYCEEA